MRKNNIQLFFLFVSVCMALALQAQNIQFITSAPTGAPNEPGYLGHSCPSVDWFSEPIGGNYYLAALSPTSTPLNKTIALYRFVPEHPPKNSFLEFVASAPTGQCIFDQFSSDDVCDDTWRIPTSLNWYPHTIEGSYFFGVVGPTLASRLGRPGQQTIRVYQFNPGEDEPIVFIDSAPLELSENESSFVAPLSINWFLQPINGLYYFSVVGDSSATGPSVRVYSFDPAADLGTNLSFVGALEENSFRGFSVDWLPEFVSGNSYFAVGGFSDSGKAIVCQFCTDPCAGTSQLPENHMRSIATAPTSAILDFSIDQVNAVKWLVFGGRYYLAAAVIENTLTPLRIQRTIRLYEFIPGKNDPTQGSLRFVTSAPTNKECYTDHLVDDALQSPTTLDWLTQDGRCFLLVGSNSNLRKKSLSGKDIRVYEFNAPKEQFQFIAAEDLIPNGALSVDWFPGLIEGNNYFVAGLKEDERGTESKEVRVYKFRPPCSFTNLSCRGE